MSQTLGKACCRKSCPGGHLGSCGTLWRKRIEMEETPRLGDLEGGNEDILGQPGVIILGMLDCTF